MKYWRGYLVAAIFGLFTYALQKFAETHAVLLDMIYPYVTRLVQDVLCNWTSGVDFCVWQLAAVILLLIAVASVILMILLRWNVIQWLGWVLATASVLFFLHTGLGGLNTYAGSIAEDIRMEQVEYTVAELADATRYYRDKANEAAALVPRSGGQVKYPDFETLAEMAANGFDNLVYKDFYPIFAGSTTPVKKLGWADMYSSMGVTGVTMALTGEAAVNPQIPVVSMPFTMCHEMAHRMSIAVEKDANFAAFLACEANDSLEFQYSAYFMAFRYCYGTLASVGTPAANTALKEIAGGMSSQLQTDSAAYDQFFASKKNETATKVADTANDTYIKVSGDDAGVGSYGNVTDLLVSRYYQQEILPTKLVEEVTFDPLDKTQVDVSDIVRVG